MFTHSIFSWKRSGKFACKVWLVIIFLLVSIQRIFLECQLMPASGFQILPVQPADLVQLFCDIREKVHCPFSCPCVCQWGRWVGSPELLLPEPFPPPAVPFGHLLRAASFPREGMDWYTVPIRTASTDSAENKTQLVFTDLRNWQLWGTDYLQEQLDLELSLSTSCWLPSPLALLSTGCTVIPREGLHGQFKAAAEPGLWAGWTNWGPNLSFLHRPFHYFL